MNNELNELNELEAAQIKILLSKIRDADIIEIDNTDNEFGVYSPDNFKLSFILSGKRFYERYIININDLADAKIVNNRILVKAYNDYEIEPKTIKIELYTKIRQEINHLAS